MSEPHNVKTNEEFRKELLRYCELQAELEQLSQSPLLKPFLEAMQGKGKWEVIAKHGRILLS